MGFSFPKSQIKEWSYTLGTSLMAGLFAYLLLHLLTELSILYFSYDLNIQAVLQVKGIRFLTSPGNPDWTRDATVTLYLVKPILNLLVAIATMILYAVIRYKSQSFSFFMIWIIIFGLNNMFGTFLENGFLKNGIYKVVEVMHLGTIPFVLMLGLSFYFLYISGVGTGKVIMLCLPGRHKSGRGIQFLYFFVAFLLPWIIILGLIFPFSDFDLKITYLFGILLLIPFLWSRGPEKEGIHLDSLPAFLWNDLISVIFFGIGIILMIEMLSMNIRFH
ncbi:MAG: hypothetical protein JXR71_06630 [Bacteroidales bacterium]|nr:hypothetical protein [Bacteroidales bacterium]